MKYRERDSFAERAHPYPDHFMPLLVAFGAAGDDARGIVLHHSWYWGDLAMDATAANCMPQCVKKSISCSYTISFKPLAAARKNIKIDCVSHRNVSCGVRVYAIRRDERRI